MSTYLDGTKAILQDNINEETADHTESSILNVSKVIAGVQTKLVHPRNLDFVLR